MMPTARAALLVPFLALPCLLAAARPEVKEDVPSVQSYLQRAERSLTSGDHAGVRALVQSALERDPRSIPVWDLRARWAEAVGDTDERVYALHRKYRLSIAQGLPKAELKAQRELLEQADPIAADLLDMNRLFIDELLPIAERYEEEGRPHSAIRIHKEILALDPERAASRAAIERIAAAPDPSLAEDAKPRDLLADVSEQWIREHDTRTREWGERAEHEGDNYRTYTNAGYEVLVRSAEAMDQMNAFYRQFFQYGTEEHGGSVPRIDLKIFRTRDEYLELGSSPAEWSGGQFTGSAVETYIGDGTFEDMVGTLFHEAAHQFVSLATNAVGWLNEGLASFFEGCRILANGTVQMNLPANHRLFPLVQRMERGWMASHDEGLSPDDPSQTPDKAPTFRIVLENRYTWGPPWYAPTWGVVYFLYNYQDPWDGRYVYRDSFRTFIDKSGGRMGEGAVENFEEVVLGDPKPPIKGVERPPEAEDMALPETVAELDAVWKDWLLRLRDEQSGKLEYTRPYFRWARFALQDKDWDTAQEHFEKALVQTPEDPEVLLAFGEFLAQERDDEDRASKLALRALQALETAAEVDTERVEDAEKLLRKWDPSRRTLQEVHEELWAMSEALVRRYQAADMPLMVMDLSWRLSTDFDVPGLMELYEEAVRRSGKSLRIWKLAYNEQNLDGWKAAGTSVFRANGAFLEAELGTFTEGNYDYQSMVLDTVTGGDFSLQAEVQATKGRVNFAGLVFGKKDTNSFHAFILHPGKVTRAEGTADSAFADLTTWFGAGSFKTWRHVPVRTQPEDERSTAGTWHTMRIDVSGAKVDMWFDGQYLATQEFSSADVLRGELGLLAGNGSSRFREVRYLALDPRDVAGEIERQVRLDAVVKEGESVGGSWLGQRPPFPEVGRWVQGERAAWDDRGHVPQLFVMWSQRQNEIIPIDGWLNELEARNRDIGLEIVSLCSPNDDGTVEAYLAEHPFPGVVGVDQRLGVGIGDTFETYSIALFNLPRVLLLDVDGKVVWEGDPGFSQAEPWVPGYESYLDVPLGELVEKRKLVQLGRWLEVWEEVGERAVAAGDVEAALPILRESVDFQKRLLDEVDAAQRKLGALEAALGALTTTAASFRRTETEPALAALLELAPLFEIEVDKRLKRDLKDTLEGDHAKDWDDVVKRIGRYEKRKKRDGVLAEAKGVLEEARGAEGAFPRQLVAELGPLVEAGDEAAVDATLAEAPALPRRWLLREYLQW